MIDSAVIAHDKKIRQLIYKTINEVNLSARCDLNAKLHGIKKKGAALMPSQRGL